MSNVIASSAFGPILLVALEQTWPASHRILDDPLAYRMLPLSMRIIVKACVSKHIRQRFYNLTERIMPGLWNSFPCRKRYIQDQVIGALKVQPQSLVILGSGLDTLPYRLSQLSNLRIYEVDLPVNIEYKREKLKELYGVLPPHVVLVPIDFETQTLESVLRQQGYSLDQRTIFIWEGVTQYLTEAAVRQTLEFLAQAKSGSQLVFTYVQKDFVDGRNLYGLERLYQRFRVKNQWWLFGLHSQMVASFARTYGWQVQEQVGAYELAQRYLKPIGRSTSIADIEWTVYAEKEAL